MENWAIWWKGLERILGEFDENGTCVEMIETRIEVKTFLENTAATKAIVVFEFMGRRFTLHQSQRQRHDSLPNTSRRSEYYRIPCAARGSQPK